MCTYKDSSVHVIQSRKMHQQHACRDTFREDFIGERVSTMPRLRCQKRLCCVFVCFCPMPGMRERCFLLRSFAAFVSSPVRHPLTMCVYRDGASTYSCTPEHCQHIVWSGSQYLMHVRVVSPKTENSGVMVCRYVPPFSHD